jgi:lipid-binding SYLF domain-containing protein
VNHKRETKEMNMRAQNIFVALMLTASTAAAAPPQDEANRLAEATRVVEETTSAPDKAIPEELWQRAHCVAVIPGLKKGAFIVGGEYGKGVVSCRTSHGWSAPAFLTLEKASWGAQIGAESVDLMLLFMNQRGMERLFENRVTLGADASIAAGPLGRNGSAATDSHLTAEILSYSRARGVFAGIDLSGGVVRPDVDADHDLYGRKITAREILLKSGAATPPPARAFVAALSRVSHETAANGVK